MTTLFYQGLNHQHILVLPENEYKCRLQCNLCKRIAQTQKLSTAIKNLSRGCNEGRKVDGFYEKPKPHEPRGNLVDPFAMPEKKHSNKRKKRTKRGAAGNGKKVTDEAPSSSESATNDEDDDIDHGINSSCSGNV